VQYKAAFPAVLLAYYDYYFDQIMASLNEIHYNIATIWNMADMCGAEREWLFERAVIATCERNRTIDHVANHPGASVPERLNVSFQKVFDNQDLLPKVNMADDGMYVPRNCCFPVIDFIWKQENIAVAVQAHASANQTLVLASFEVLLTNQASWGEFERVFLLYLSPDEVTATKMREKVDKDKPSGNHANLVVVVASLSDFSRLRDILPPVPPP
jgi:hypothetical protein